MLISILQPRQHSQTTLTVLSKFSLTKNLGYQHVILSVYLLVGTWHFQSFIYIIFDLTLMNYISIAIQLYQ